MFVEPREWQGKSPVNLTGTINLYEFPDSRSVAAPRRHRTRILNRFSPDFQNSLNAVVHFPMSNIFYNFLFIIFPITGGNGCEKQRTVKNRRRDDIVSQDYQFNIIQTVEEFLNDPFEKGYFLPSKRLTPDHLPLPLGPRNV